MRDMSADSQTSPFDPLWRGVVVPLRARIVSGALAPGEPLSEIRLAAEFGVSRTPVREALRTLIGEGLVQVLPGRKIRVSLPDLDDIREVYDVRIVLESEAVRRLPRQPKAAKETLTAMRRACADSDRALAAKDLPGLATANEAFHRALVAALDNRRLQAQYDNVHDLIELYRHHSLRSDDWAAAGVEEHKELLRLIERGHNDAAIRLLASHIETARQVVSERFHPGAAQISANRRTR
jgi:DNA-binding GntR family transcriptional regulator